MGNPVHNFCIIMGMDNKFLPLNKVDYSLSPEDAEKIVRKDCNNFLKTYKGLSCLRMKYPNLLVSQAIDKYIKEALWIDSIV